MVGASCSDGDACTAGDHCDLAGACTSSAATACGDGNPCTDDSCDPAKGCTFVNNQAPCSDGSACTTGDVCAAGLCAGGKLVNCDDGKGCTTDQCDPAQGCVSVTQTGAACSDGDACTLADTCTGGTCTPGVKFDCNDGNACTDDACDSSKGCTHVTKSSGACDDGNPCTVSDSCVEGKCLAGGLKNCDDGNDCTKDSCDVTKGCVVVAVADGDACQDGSACTLGDSCKGGKCVAGGPALGPVEFAIPGFKTAVAAGATAAYADGFLVIGQASKGTGAATDAGWAARVRDDGKIVWLRTYGAGTAYSLFSGVVDIGDGRALAVGQSSVKGYPTDVRGWAVTIDAEGELIDQKFLGTPGTTMVFNTVHAFANGTWLVGGASTLPSGGAHPDATIADINVSASGIIQLGSARYFPNAYPTDVNAIAPCGSQFCLLGHSGAGNHGGGYLQRIDTNLKAQGPRKYFYEDGKDQGFVAAIAASDGGLLALGLRHSSGLQTDYQPWLVRFDSTGGVVWDKKLPVTQSVLPGAFATLSDDSFMLAGYTFAGTASGEAQLWFAKINGLGAELWHSEFGGAGAQLGYVVVALPSGGVVVAGSDGNKGIGLALRVNDLGNTDCGKLGVCDGKSLADCDDGLPCTADTCDDKTGCKHSNLADGSACDDGKPCTTDGNCLSGKCQAGAPSLFETTFPALGGGFLKRTKWLDSRRAVAVGARAGTGGADLWVVGMDDAGAVKWQPNLAGIDYEGASALDVGGETVVVGGSRTAQGTDKGLVAKITWGEAVASLGPVQVSYPGANDESIAAVVARSDGGVAYCGTTQPAEVKSVDHAWFGIVDNLGGVKPNIYLGSGQGTEAEAMLEVQGDTTKYLLVGRDGSSTADPDPWAAMVTETGETLWKRRYFGSGVVAMSVVAVPGGYFMAGGASGSLPSGTVWLARCDLYGNLMWASEPKLPLTASYGRIAAFDTDKLVLVGADKQAPDQGSSVAAVLDHQGNALWASVLGSASGPNVLWDVAPTPAGIGLLAVGSTASKGAASSGWAIRADAFGHTACADAGSCAEKLPAACDDGEPCTADGCDGKAGCSHVALVDKAPCDDGDACTAGDICAGGTCAGASEAFGVALVPGTVQTLADVALSPSGVVVAAGVVATGKPADSYDSEIHAFGADGKEMSGYPRSIALPEADYLTAIETNSDSIIAVGSRQDGANGSNARVVRMPLVVGQPTSFDLSLGKAGQDGANDVAIAPDGTAWLAGFTPNNITSGLYSGWVVGVSPAGVPSYFVYAEADWSDQFQGIGLDGSGNRAMAGFRRSQAANNGIDVALVVATKPDGTVIFSQTYPGLGASAAASVWPGKDGSGWLVAGTRTANFGNKESKFILIRLNSGGVVQWEKQIGTSTLLSYNRGTLLSDGSVLLAGYDVVGGNAHGLVIKTTIEGLPLWSRSLAGYPAIGNSRVNGAAELPNGAIVLAGIEEAKGKGMLARLDPWGNATCTACAGLTPDSCNDGDPTTLDLCDPAKGCVHIPN
ncbi:MAG: hypothetical protein HY902_18115 [Deltaproteobacteria bacterium]|nr:hypothetical protein [Deltaproteobacteria bacterium]